MSGGSETTTQETKLPDWVTDAAKANIARADEISRIGYVPNYLPQVAALAPEQRASINNTNNMASAFGLQGGGGSYLPQAETYANGVQGYGTWDLAQQGIDRLKQERPGQYEAITGLFIDPETGTQGTLADNPLTGRDSGVNYDTLNAMRRGGAMSAQDYLSTVLNGNGPDKPFGTWDDGNMAAIGKISGK